MSLLTNFDTNSNFWKLNPQLTIPKPLNDLYSKDKSKGKEDSSLLMWAICLLIDPSDENKFNKFPEEDRKELIKADFLKDPKFKFEQYQSIIDWYKEGMLTQAERSLLNWHKKLQERDKFIADTTYDLDTASELDKVMANTDKLYSQYERIVKQYEKEKTESRNRGNKKASLSDQDLI